ncbi:OmpP1/FadL family transporter [Acinetobacter tibetensis]|uniref:Outer membrane protein transport protein n=1 Tax=Acinetobacter tibetensis TaxID=2943497 RepID=A0AAE9LQ66_9GAMM|nr:MULTISPECIES: outer membrane protein transport protein [Acinetobacter]PWB15485.1 transporter [Acinetobacter sp. AM]USE82679.1 outer membrane protein transport protein [Acinetobacter tibetensis]HEX5380892.1 outer membrane protein transport protein [Acinetobacter sp.]
MKLKALTTAMILAALPTAGAFAAALDRSGQSISAFLQPGNYFEAGISILDPDVSGKDISGNNASDMAGDYYFPTAALKLQLTDQFSFGLLYDQPYGAEAEYTGNNNFVAKQSDRLLPSASSPTLGQAGLGNVVTGGTSVEVDTQNLNFILGYQPTANWNLYGGAVYQTVKGNVKLRGSAYSLYNGYDADIKETGDFGWLAGVAYQIPEIALKASLTYRSEIEHNAQVNENIPIVNLVAANPTLLFGALGITDPATQQAIGQKLAALGGSGKTDITTPQSVNLDFQTGIMANTVAFANLRWVNWKDFSIQPYKFGLVSQAAGQLLPQLNKPNGFNLVDYSDDQWSANVGVGRKLTEQWAGNVSVGWDSGAGNPVTTLGPTEGYWNLGLGVQYSPTPATFIAGGVKYFWLGDADAQTGAHSAAGTFSDNDALAYGLKLGYRF